MSQKINIVDNPKVLLVRPPQLFYFGVWPRGPRLGTPVGLLSIASFLENQDIDVQIYDCFVEGDTFKGDQLNPNHPVLSGSLQNSKSNKLNEETLYEFTYELNRPDINNKKDEEVSNNEVSKKKSMLHFGASWDQFKKDLIRIQPDIVGLTNLFRENTSETIQAADLIRAVLPNAVIVVGGPNASALPDHMLDETNAINIIGLGDGENTMQEIVEWVRGKRKISTIKSIVYRDNKEKIRTEKRELVVDLDEFGKLNYDLLKLERYFTYERYGIMARNKFSYDGAERSVSLVTSRGCPYKCSFCSIHIHAGRKYRRYSVENVLDHIENLTENYGVRHIHFEDDNLTLDRKRFMELMNGIIDRGLKFTWDTPNGTFANALDEEMMYLIKKTGCIYLIVAPESGDQWVIDNVINKQPLLLENVVHIFKLAKKIGIDIQAFYIIGFPRETLKQINTTLKFAMNALKKYDVLPHIALARADPGTDLFAEAKKNGHLVTDVTVSNTGGVHADMFTRHLISNDEFTPEKLNEINVSFHRRAVIVFSLKTLKNFLKHPMIAISNMIYFIKNFKKSETMRDSLVKLFFCRLFYLNSLKRIKEFEKQENSPVRHSQEARFLRSK